MKEEHDADDNMIPRQQEGSKLDVDFVVRAQDEAEAHQLFMVATERLLNVNEWDRICGPLSAVFRLTDGHGNGIARSARPGDYFMIDVPGPGPAAGEGYDWVQVEALDDDRHSDGHEESVTM